jgi:hypothetical protein
LGLKERLFGKKDDTAFQFSAAAAQTDLANPSNSSSSQEYVDTVGKIGYLLDSTEMQQFFSNHQEFSPLIPAFQSVIRTTKINNHEAQMMWLGYKILTLKLKADLASKFPQVDYSAIFMSLEILFESIISDAKDGWKGHLTTEQVRRLDVVLNKKDHGR